PLHLPLPHWSALDSPGLPALLRVPRLRRRRQLAPGAAGAEPLAVRHPGPDQRGRGRRGDLGDGEDRRTRLRAPRRARHVADAAVRARLDAAPAADPRAAHGDARNRARPHLLERAARCRPSRGDGGTLRVVTRVLLAFLLLFSALLVALVAPQGQVTAGLAAP